MATHTDIDDIHELAHGASLAAVRERARRLEPLSSWVQAADDIVPLQVSRSALPLAIAALHAQRSSTLLLVVENDNIASEIADELGWYVGDNGAASYVARGATWGSGVAAGPARVALRERAREVARAGGVVVASVEALAERVPLAELRPHAVDIEAGAQHDRDAFVRALVDIGYRRVDQAEDPGEIAVRGDIVDVVAAGESNPFRIEFFDDEVEAIREFSAYTQRSLARRHSIRIEPVCEHIGMPPGDVLADLESHDTEPGWRAFGDDTPMLVWQTDVVSSAREALDLDALRSHCSHGYADDAAIEALLSGCAALDPLPLGQRFRIDAEPPVSSSVGLAEAEAALRGYVQRGLRVAVTFVHGGHAERVQRRMRDIDITMQSASLPSVDATPELLPEEAGVTFVVSPATSGFVSTQLGIAVLPSARLLRRVTDRADRGPSTRALSAFSHLHPGDYVVHEEHGIAQFSGFETRTVAGITRDYLVLDYAGEDRVFVPHEQMGRVSRYIGADGGAPKLSKLGGKRWDTLKNRARTAVRELAGDLLALYAKRAKAVGVAFDEDDEMMLRFEAAFPYEETPDQLAAITAVRHDLERPQPMDRLVCGDVGFGKTEVALRAALKVVAAGRQVMVLVPTTVLASQHFATFRERFDGLPVEVEMVSRFRTGKDINAVLERFTSGRVDVLIGTHRLLSRDVLPKNLGLVIVDEEQRFGVAQKELLRHLRVEVDVLAMSATPIPRTLHMSLAGIRDISVIETPPKGRRPVATHVGEYDEEMVVHAIRREIERDGQVFYLHNRVETIDEVAVHLAQLVPQARIAIGHGQMGERDLERVMTGFMRRDFDVLVATTIIESGLDIPAANTLIIDRADMLGLSQLHQIRGRVGRSSRSAHAYLFYPSARELSEEARARLTTLSDFSDLGAGARIALRDLELRGAGNLLGAEQSGHVAAVGFELYVEMLAQAVNELSGARVMAERPVAIDAKVSAFVPADWVASEAIKIDVHRRISLAHDIAELDELLLELADRFGEVPDPVINLVTLSRLRIDMNAVHGERLSISDDKIVIAPVDLDDEGAARLRALEPLIAYSASKGELAARVPDRERRLERAAELLANLRRAMISDPDIETPN